MSASRRRSLLARACSTLSAQPRGISEVWMPPKKEAECHYHKETVAHRGLDLLRRSSVGNHGSWSPSMVQGLPQGSQARVACPNKERAEGTRQRALLDASRHSTAVAVVFCPSLLWDWSRGLNLERS